MIEDAITTRTSAILPTHVYGIPRDVDKIKQIAEKHGLKVIYDATHAFGVRYQGKSLTDYGDASILSFYATKLFHTIEGGAIITKDEDIAHRIRYMRNFSHKGKEDFWGLGINGKNSEVHAAMGLCVLPYVNDIIMARYQVTKWYEVFLDNKHITRPTLPKHTEYNYAYFPVLFHTEEQLIKVQENLHKHNIFPRRYFYPSLTTLPYISGVDTIIAQDFSKRVLCLPIYHDLTLEDVKTIAYLIDSGDEHKW